MRLSGHSPSHDAKCASVFQRVMSTPTSLMTVWATPTSMPSIRVRSTPLMRDSSQPRSNCGAWLPALRRRLGPERRPKPGSHAPQFDLRSEAHTSELQSLAYLGCRLLPE